ncbi:hypothetical protein BsWGS_27541 [Bradybaena similaris]
MQKKINETRISFPWSVDTRSPSQLSLTSDTPVDVQSIAPSDDFGGLTRQELRDAMSEALNRKRQHSIPASYSVENMTHRDSWTGRLDFLLSCIGFAVGLGNIWRFPYLCYKSGGGAFLIPYTFFLITCGLPLFFLEVSYGQFGSLSPISVWRMSPLFRGLGYGMVIISAIVCIYYNVIIAWNFYFLFSSFSGVLPWTLCDQSWNTPHCMVLRNSSLSGNGTQSVLASSEFWE